MPSRNALLEFYSLQAKNELSGPTGSVTSPLNDSGAPPSEEVEEATLLDAPDFDALKYGSEILERDGVIGLVKAFNEIVHQAKALDSEQEALVYNNYKKLIRASDALGYLNRQGDLAGLDSLKASLDSVKAFLEPKPDDLETSEISPKDASQRLNQSRAAYREKYGNIKV